MISIKNLDCILLVDDDSIYNLLHKKLINSTGYKNHIEIALNGQIALDYLNDSFKNPHDTKHPLPRLILLDINMPLMNGWEFIEAFNKLDKNLTRDITIVMVTSSADHYDSNMAQEITAIRDYISKPLTTNKLEYIIKTCLV